MKTLFRRDGSNAWPALSTCWLAAGVAAAALAALAAPLAAAPAAEPAAGAGSSAVPPLLAAAEGRPGIALLVGCADPDLALALHRGGFALVHGVDRDGSAVDSLRAQAFAAGIYGAVTAEQAALDRLPLADELANLVAIDDLPRREKEGLTLAEALRVLAPYGTLAVGGGNAASLQKELAAAGWPDAAPSTHGTWLCVQKPYPATFDDWPMALHDAGCTDQSHDQQVGPVTRVRWIQAMHRPDNKAPMTDIVTAKGRIFYARHAASSALFGSLPPRPGFEHTLEARDAFNGTLLWEHPIWCPAIEELSTRRSAAIATDGDRVYARVAKNGAVSALDAASGKVLRTFSAGGDIALYDHRLVLRQGDDRWLVIDPDTGETERTFGAPGVYYDAPFLIDENRLLLTESGAAERPAAGRPLTATAAPARGTLACYDFHTGERLWAQPNLGNGFLYWSQRGLILTRAGNEMNAFVLKDGSHLWKATMGTKLFAWPACFYQGDTIWGYGDSSWYFAYDPTTGKRLHGDAGRGKEFGRCNPDRATGKYILGPEFEVWDMVNGRMWNCLFARADCTIGWIPGNGLAYNGYTPDSCACNNGITGTFALSCDPPPSHTIRAEDEATAFVKGPAFGAAGGSIRPQAGEWPAFRHDNYRSSATTADVPVHLRTDWSTKLVPPLSAPVVAGGLVLAACVDEGRLVALDAETGRLLWSFLAGGRVDSPPTLYQGLALFGCRDGWLYAVAAADGRLVWRRRVAPEDRLISVRGRLESAWPVFGAVAIEGGVVYANAGRHGDADGGLWLLAADPATGDVKRHVNIHGFPPFRDDPQLRLIEARGKIPADYSEAAIRKVDPKYLAGIGGSVVNDVLVSDGTTLFLNAVGMNLASGEISAVIHGKSLYTYGSTMVAGPDLTRFAPTEKWRYEGSTEKPAWRIRGTGPDGFQIAMDDGNVYRMATSRSIEASGDSAAPRQGLENGQARWQRQFAANAQLYAMMVARDKLVAAARVEETGGSVHGEVQVLSARNGETLGVSRLDQAPAWQGLAAVNGRMYMTCEDGSVQRLGPDSAPPVCAGPRILAAGSEATRTLAFPQGAQPQLPVTLAWSARFGDTTASTGTVTIAIATNLASPIVMRFPVPDGTARCEGAFTFRWKQAGRDMGETDIPLVALPAGPKPAIETARLAVWDPAGTAGAYLDRRGIGHTTANGLDAVPPETRVLLVGSNVVTPELAKSPRWRQLLRQGVRILVLDQQTVFGRNVLGIDTGNRQPERQFEIVDPAHPAFDGLAAGDLSNWDPTTCRVTYAAQDVRALLAAQGGRVAALAEFPMEQGRLTVCQLALGEQLKTNPAAQRLLDNLLGDCSAFVPHRLGVAIAATDPRNDQLMQAGLVFDQIDDVLAAMKDGRYDRIVADASAPRLRQLAAQREAVQSFAERGGWLMLWGLTPEGLADFDTLVGVDHLLRPFANDRVVLAKTADRLAFGLAPNDLNITGDGYGYWGEHKTATDAYTYVASLDDIAPFCTLPGPEYWKQNHTGPDREPRNVLNGYTDFWQFGYVFDLGQGAPADIPMTLPREEQIVGFRMSPGPYNRVRKIRLEFDRRESAPVEFAIDPDSSLAETSFAPRRAKQVTVRFVDWEPSQKASIIGVNNLWLLVATSDAFKARVEPLANIGVLVKYGFGPGGILLNQFRVPTQDEIDARLAKEGKAALKRVDQDLSEKRHAVCQILRNLDVAYVTRAPLARSLTLTDNDWVFASGSKVTRTVPLGSAEAYRFPMTVVWNCTVADKVADHGEKTFAAPEDLPAKLDIPMALPEVEDRAAGEFTLVWKQGDKERFRGVWPLAVISGDAGKAPTFGPDALAVWDPAGTAAKRLTARGVAFTLIKGPSELPPQASVLVIGPDALDEQTSAASLWREGTQRGLRIVALDQICPFTRAVLGRDVSPGAWSGNDPKAADPYHPLLAGLQESDFAAWPGGTVVRGAYGAGKDPLRSILGDKGGKATALVEFPCDAGLVLCAQVAMGHRLDSSPVAQRLFENLLRYAQAYVPHGLASALPAGSPKAELLAATGLKTAVAADPVAAMADGKRNVILVEAAPDVLGKLLAASDPRQTFFGRGGWLVLWGLGPEGLDAFNRLVDVPHLLRPFESELIHARPEQHLLNGLADDDLNLQVPIEGVAFPDAKDWYGAVDLDDMAPFCQFPEPEHFGDLKASPFYDHWPRHMVQGFLKPDHWRKSFLILNVTQGKPFQWDLKVPRDTDIDGCSVVVNTAYRHVSKMRLTFDGGAPETLALQDNDALQTLSFVPRHVNDRVGVELLDWDTAGDKSNNIGLNVLRLHMRRPADEAARLHPLVDPGVLVSYPREQGGILLVQIRPQPAAERDARVAEAGAKAGGDAAAREKLTAELRLHLDRNREAQVRLLRQLLWNLGVEEKR